MCVCGELLWCMVSWVNCSVQHTQDSDGIGASGQQDETTLWIYNTGQ